MSCLGVVQGMITGIRGLCNGLGPALYGFVFYLFHVELTDTDGSEKGAKVMVNPTDEVRMLLSVFWNWFHHWFKCCALTNAVFTECHHSRSSLPLWCMLSAALSAGGPVHPRAHGARHEARRLQKAQQRGTKSLPQPTRQRGRGQRAAAGGQQCITSAKGGADSLAPPPPKVPAHIGQIHTFLPREHTPEAHIRL